MKKRIVLSIVAVLGVSFLGGGLWAQEGQPSAPAANVMAYVNGKPVAMDRLHELLVGAYGLPIAQQLVASELASQEARLKGVSVTEQDIRAEHDLTLKETFPQETNPEQRERMLDTLLRQRNMGRNLWQVIMARNALLRKLAGNDFDVSESELKVEFGRRYERKAVIRHIQVQTAAEAQKVYDLAQKGDFAALATKYSIHPSGQNGGLLPPIGAGTSQVNPALRQAALAMSRPGEISHPVQTGTSFHVLKLERIEEPSNVNFADVKDTLAADLREQKARTAVNQLLAKLVAEAKIQYVDRQLRDQAEKAVQPAETPR